MPRQRGEIYRNGKMVDTSGLQFPDHKTQPSTRCSVFSCEAEFKQEVKNRRAFIHDYLEAGWSYHYTPRGIRPVCPAHRILVDQSDAAV